MRKVIPKGKSRFNLILDTKLKNWIKQYADRHNTNVTNIVIATFQQLYEGEKSYGDIVRNLSWEEIPDPKMRLWAENYAAKYNTTVNELINMYFINLKREEDGFGIKQI